MRFRTPNAGARPIRRIRRVQNSVYSVTVGVAVVVAVAVAVTVAVAVAVTMAYLSNKAIGRNSHNASQTSQLPT